MNRCVIYKFVVAVFLVGSYFLLPKCGFTSFSLSSPFSNLSSHFLYPFSHANIFHLAANILCLFMLRCPLHLLATYAIAVLASFLPSFSLYEAIANSHLSSPFSTLSEPTYGFSGILFAIVGITWGRAGRFREMLSRNKWFLIIPAFIPHINFLIHFYCLILGYAYGRWVFASRTGKRLFTINS